MKKIIFTPCFIIINFFLRIPFVLTWFNALYERSPQKLVNLFHEYVVFPNKTRKWIIHLRNGKTVTTDIYQNNRKTLEFAIDYRWYSPGFAIMEKEIHEYYNKDHIFLDIGANLGIRSLIPLSLGRYIYMFEPNSETNSLNLERCKMNNYTNYEIIPMAVSSGSETMPIYYDESSYLSTLEKPSIEIAHRYNNAIVKTISIDEFLNINSKSYKGFIVKIDVEGHEWDVVCGAASLIKQYQPTLFIEINEGGSHRSRIFNFFRDLEYRIFEINTVVTEGILKEIGSEKDITTDEITSCDFLFSKEKQLINSLRTM